MNGRSMSSSSSLPPVQLEDGRTEPCLKASLLQSRLTDNREWQRNEDLKFTFSYAEFDED